MVLAWLSRRYTRTAFPENFVKRVNTRRTPIGKKLSRPNPLVTNVYVSLNPFNEQEEDKEYTVEIILVMDAEQFDDEEKHQMCNKIGEELESQLKKCDSILVEDIRIESTANITIEDLKGYREWDYSYLSFRDSDNAAMPIET